jgi:hypothetical protein
MSQCSRIAVASIVRETEKALLVYCPSLLKEVWIPRSQVLATFRNDDLRTWTMYLSLWYGRKIGITQ